MCALPIYPGRSSCPPPAPTPPRKHNTPAGRSQGREHQGQLGEGERGALGGGARGRVGCGQLQPLAKDGLGAPHFPSSPLRKVETALLNSQGPPTSRPGHGSNRVPAATSRVGLQELGCGAQAKSRLGPSCSATQRGRGLGPGGNVPCCPAAGPELSTGPIHRSTPTTHHHPPPPSKTSRSSQREEAASGVLAGAGFHDPSLYAPLQTPQTHKDHPPHLFPSPLW